MSFNARMTGKWDKVNQPEAEDLAQVEEWK
jgi:hypothetical protein